MPIDPHKDYTRQEQLDLDLTELFANGFHTEDGQLRLELQGIGVAAMALQTEASGVPMPMFNRMLTTANEISLKRAQEMPDELVEELEKRGHPGVARVIRAGIAACRTTQDYHSFFHWLMLVRNLMALRARST